VSTLIPSSPGIVRLPVGMVVEDSRAATGDIIPDRGQMLQRTVCSNQLDVAIASQVYRSDYCLNSWGPNLLKLSFIQKGRFDLSFGKRDIIENFDHRCLLIAQPEGIVKTQRNYTDDEHRCVTLIFAPQFISETLSDIIVPEHSILREYADGKISDLHLEDHIMDHQMLTCLASIVGADLTDPLSGMLIESKVLELLYLFFKQLRGTAPVYEGLGASLSLRQRARMDEVKDLLDCKYLAPPSLDQLGRTVGMSRSKLAALFKEHNGLTVGEYCHALRMLRSRELLRSETESISEISYRMGYEHQSSFSQAYRGFFGVSPKDDRGH